MLLDANYDTSVSCFHIASETAVFVLCGAIVVLIVGATVVGAEYATAVDRAAWRQKHLWRVLFAFMGVVPLITLLVFMTAFDGKKRKELFVDGDNLVETGCVKLTEYRYEFPMKGVILTYEHDDIKGGNDYLRISAGARVLRVDLRHADQWQNLSLFAPASMRKYAAYLRQNGRVVPPEIDNIP